MGKKGDLLRAQKRATTTYSFTLEQLVKHDYDVEQRTAKRVRKEMRTERDKQLLQIFSLLISMPMVVLVEHFGWAPPYIGRNSHRYKSVRFGDLMVEEIDKVFGNGKTAPDWLAYNERAKELYGIEFKVVE